MDGYKVPDVKWPKGTKWAKLPSGRMVAEVEVSPELAAAMLEYNAGNQRKLKPATVARYASDMSGGAWRLTHQGVAFNRDGKLHDGQNRLSAVVESGCTVTMTVWVGAGGDGEMTVIDTNAPRSVLDAAKVVRMDLDRKAATTVWAAVRYGVVNGHSLNASLTHTGRLQLLDRYRDETAALGDWFGGSQVARKLGSGPVRGAVLCAMAFVDHETLARFVRVLTEQEDPRAGEGIAKHLRGFLFASAGAVPDRDVFLKTCRAVQHFVNREQPSKLVAPAENPFPFDIA